MPLLKSYPQLGERKFLRSLLCDVLPHIIRPYVEDTNAQLRSLIKLEPQTGIAYQDTTDTVSVGVNLTEESATLIKDINSTNHDYLNLFFTISGNAGSGYKMEITRFFIMLGFIAGPPSAIINFNPNPACRFFYLPQFHITERAVTHSGVELTIGFEYKKELNLTDDTDPTNAQACASTNKYEPTFTITLTTTDQAAWQYLTTFRDFLLRDQQQYCLSRSTQKLSSQESSNEKRAPQKQPCCSCAIL